MIAGHRRFALLLIVVFVLPMLLASCGKTVGDTIDDATISTRVKTALLNDPDVGALRIDVNTAAGVVTLSGAVKSPAEADRAVQIAQTVKGVKQVKSALQVSKSSVSSQ